MGIEQIAVLCALAANSLYDLRKKEILFTPTVCFACGGAVFSLVKGADVCSILTGLIPGALLGAVSLLSRQAVGFGDAVMIMSVGVWNGWGPALFTLIAALAVQSVTAVIYRLAGGRKKELPFLPAMLAGYILYLLITF